MVAHLVAVALTVTVTAVAALNYSFFSWHPVCMTAAYAFLMTEAMLMFSPSSSLFTHAGRVQKINYHSYMLFCALLSAIGGFTVIYTNKNINGYPHFTSLHGIVGVATVVYTVVQVAAGVALRYRWLPKSLMTPSRWRMVHGLSGCTLLCVSCLAMIGGMRSNWYIRNVHQYLQGASMVGVLLLASVSVSQMKEIVSTANRRQPMTVKK